PQRRLGKRNRHFAIERRAFPVEQLVGPDGHVNVQIAGRAAAQSRLTFAGQRDALAVVDARRNPHIDATHLTLSAPAHALATRRFHYPALSPAAGTHGHVDKAAEGRLPCLTQLARTATLRTGDDIGAGLTA